MHVSGKHAPLGLLAAGCFFPILPACSDKQPDRMNLLVIVVDQLKYDAIGASGNSHVITPNIDRLASQGAYFTHAYTQCAVSGPGRASILTGLMVEHTGVLTNEMVMQDPSAYGLAQACTYDQLLASCGYRCEFHGNWHSPLPWVDCYSGFSWQPLKAGNPYSYLTDENADYRRNMRLKYPQSAVPDSCFYENSNNVGPYVPDPIDRKMVAGSGTKTVRADDHGRLLINEDETLTALYAQNTIEAMRNAVRDGEAFDITVSFFNPHPPVLPIGKYRDLYCLDSLEVPGSIADPMTDSPYRESNGRLKYTEYADSSLVRHMIRNYYATVSEVDRWVGEILAELDSLGVAGNTMVVFLADHGELLGAHGMRGKDVFYEEASRVPLILRLPGGIRPVTVDSPVSTMSLLSTITDYLSIPDSTARDAASLRPLINGRKNSEPLVTEWLYRGEKDPSHMIVKDGWKLILNYSESSDVRPALYNLVEDPHEMNNLIGESSPEREIYLKKAAEMKAEMVRWLERRGSGYACSINHLNDI